MKRKIFILLIVFCCFLGISAKADSVAYINNMRVYVSGRVSNNSRNDIFVIAVKKNSDISSADSILYANQIQTDKDGFYEINFNTTTTDMDLYVNNDGGIKKQIQGKEYNSKYFVVCDLNLKEIDENILKVSAEIKNIFSETNDVNLYIAMYEKENKLIGVENVIVPMGEDVKDVSKEIKITLPEGVHLVKSFAWIDLNPVSEFEMFYKNFPKKRLSIAREKHNIFTTDEDIYYIVSGAEDEKVHYTVKDFWKNIVCEGEFTLKESEYKMKFPVNTPGYYTLDFDYEHFRGYDLKTEYLCIVTNHNFDDVTGSPFGVNMHLSRTDFGVEAVLVDYVALMGAKSIRTDYEWKFVENEKGKYSINRNGLDEMRRHNLRMNLSTGYGNELYEGQQWIPWSDEGKKAFTNYILGVLEETGDLVEEIDLWNEWYGGGDPDSHLYYKLLQECYPAIKEKYPNIMILANACDFAREGQNYLWYPKFLSCGGYNVHRYMDGIFPHIYYDDGSPEKAITNAKKFYDKYNKSFLYTGGKNLKMYLTETGISTYDGGNISEEMQASVLVRGFVTALYSGFEKVYWYDFMNDGWPSYEREYNFGLVRYATDSKGKYVPKPSYAAYAVMARQLTGYECVDLIIPEDNNGVYKAVFSNGEKTKMVFWSLADNMVNLEKEHKITDIMGVETTGTILNTNIYPQYCELLN